MEKKNIDWQNLGFAYLETDQRYVSNYKDGAWDEGTMTSDPNVVINECACVLQYAQTCFEGLKAYTAEDGSIVMFRPDLNAARMAKTAKRLEMPPFPEERFVEAVHKTEEANAALWFRCDPVCTSLYVWLQCDHWCKAGGRVSVPCIYHTGGTLFQGRRKAYHHPCQRL